MPSELPPPSYPPPDLSLATTFEGGGNNDGNMFDIVASSSADVLVHNFNIHSSYEGLNMVEVYSRYGSFQNVTYHPTAWSKISGDDLAVVGNGFGRETPLPFGSFEPLQISSGRTQSFYIAIINGRFMQHTLSSSMMTGDIYVSTDALSLKVGVSKNYDFFDTHHNVIWNGRICIPYLANKNLD